LGGTALKTGLSFQWLGDILGERPKALEVLAKASPPLARGLLYLPSLPGALQGGFLGLSLQQRLGDLARAIMEGGAISVSAVVQAFRRLGAEPYEIRVTGGQSQSPLWNQTQAFRLLPPRSPKERFWVQL
jgi:xylulokinase